MNRRLAVFAASLAAVALLATVPARAGTATNTLTVSANVLGACTIAPASLDFLNYDPSVATPHDASGTITVLCTQGTTYWIGLGLGANASGTQRRMAGGTSEHLTYELFRDAARTAADVWDNTDGGLGNSTATTVAAGLSPYTHTVYGRIDAGQNVSTGAYSDSVQMTVNF